MSKIKVIPWNTFFEQHRQKEQIVKLDMLSSFTLAPLILSTTSDKIDTLGNSFLSITYKAGFWIILIAGITQIIKGINEQDRRKIIETLLTYSLMYGALYLLPEAMRMIDSIFNQ